MPERVKSVMKDVVLTVPIPQSTESYTTVSNLDLLTKLRETLATKELIPFRENYTLAANGNQLYGNWMLTSNENIEREKFEPGDQVLSINFINSYDKKLKLSITPGIATCICSNQAMSRTSIATFNRKHTGSINEEFPIFIESSLEGMHTLYEKMLSDFAKLKEVSLNKKLMSELAGRLFIKEDLITAEQVSLLKREIERPTFDQFIPENAYSFYQHCTWSIRKSSPSEVIDRYTGIHEFITHEFAL